ncbi:heavy-metal-associated domain-containing protein, partial [Pseudomonas canadensis]|uniref:heavy-metal-associated domain-containing protein n=2 Tax=Pseudomonadota TaxID=1224 RepID=UPI0030DDD9E7
LLKETLVPLVGNERFLSFHPKQGFLDVDVASGIGAEAVITAVSATGMTAEPEMRDALEEKEADIGGCSGCSGDPAPAEPARSDRPNDVIFTIHGMDCGDEVAVLKREVGPIVGLENLSFDLINGRMSVTGATDAAHHPRIFKAIERTGMSAELWQEGDRSVSAQG